MNNYTQFFLRQPLSSLSVFITLLPIAIIWYRRAYSNKALRVLFYYLIVKLAIDMVMLHYAAYNLNNLLFYNINIPIRYILLSSMLYHYFDSKRYKQLLLFSAIFFVLFSIWDIVSANKDLTDTYNHTIIRYSATIESVLMIFWLLAFYYEAIQSLKIDNLLAFPFFWICGGLLLFYSSFVFIAPLMHYNARRIGPLDLGFLLYVPYLFEIISIVLIAVGIMYYSPRPYDRS